jgi:hypothetical protein
MRADAEKAPTRDEMLDDITLFWLTNTAASCAQLYWENNNNNFNAVEQKTAGISIPIAVTVFPGEIYQVPKSWTQQSYRKLIYFNKVDKGGHFAPWNNRKSSLQNSARLSIRFVDLMVPG